jgi:hypothetical protein
MSLLVKERRRRRIRITSGHSLLVTAFPTATNVIEAADCIHNGHHDK